MIVCYQYNFTNGVINFIPPTRISHGQWLFCDNPKYEGYPVAIWKIKQQ